MQTRVPRHAWSVFAYSVHAAAPMVGSNGRLDFWRLPTVGSSGPIGLWRIPTYIVGPSGPIGLWRLPTVALRFMPLNDAGEEFAACLKCDRLFSSCGSPDVATFMVLWLV